jgi:hypothetical protein
LICDDLLFDVRKGLRCQHAIFVLMATIDNFTARGNSVKAAASDIWKAFDTLKHSELVGALTKAGVSK